MPYAAINHPFIPPPELATGRGACRVAIAGAGPVGLAVALDLARKGVSCVVLERGSAIAPGSKAICWAKRTLEVFARLGCGRRMRDKGVLWKVGKTFWRDRPEPVYEVDLLPEQGHEFPAFVNLQQYYVEQYLHELLLAEPSCDLRWHNEVVGVTPAADGVGLRVRTPAGEYHLEAEYLLAADGSHSTVRRLLALPFAGRTFDEHFLIADIRMRGEFPAERRFWFDPPFCDGQSALLHKQPDDMWRTDFQLGRQVDRGREIEPSTVARRVRGLVGNGRDFDFEWISIYTFSCRRLERFRHGRIVFLGDAAHLVSPFGARGGNGGIQDADNLAWKLTLVLDGRAGPGLLDSYDAERGAAADENILNACRATDFMTPRNAASATLRTAVLELANECAFARSLVNSGRLSVPTLLQGSTLNTPDEVPFRGLMVPGAACTDAPVECEGRKGWLLAHLGERFTLLYFDDGKGLPAACAALASHPLRPRIMIVTEAACQARGLVDATGLVRQRYDGEPGTLYLIRPDQHVAARWRCFDAEKTHRALAAAVGGGGT